MKYRYFMLPFIIIFFMILVIDYNSEIVNKVLIDSNRTINYPFFDNDNIDIFIENYLNMTSNNYSDDIFIDYDGYLKENKYYLSFYKYIVGSGKISNDIDSFIIDMDNDKVEKGIASTYMNDYIIYDNDVISNKYIALTFDDGPNYNTNKVLDILEENNVPATFFVLGNRIKGNENILKRMVSSKMEIGNHTFNHLLLTKYKEDRVKSEINDTSNLIFEVTGKYPTLFRPSYGSCNKMIRSVVDTPIIIWDIDTLDWKYHNSRRISSRVINKVKDGDIVLMHDIYSATANALEIIIPSLKSKGYTFVTVSDLFYYKNIPLEKGKPRRCPARGYLQWIPARPSDGADPDILFPHPAAGGPGRSCGTSPPLFPYPPVHKPPGSGHPPHSGPEARYKLHEAGPDPPSCLRSPVDPPWARLRSCTFLLLLSGTVQSS